MVAPRGASNCNGASNCDRLFGDAARDDARAVAEEHAALDGSAHGARPGGRERQGLWTDEELRLRRRLRRLRRRTAAHDQSAVLERSLQSVRAADETRDEGVDRFGVDGARRAEVDAERRGGALVDVRHSPGVF